MRIPRSTRAFRRRSTTPISRPTACTLRSAPWRNILRRIPRSTRKNLATPRLVPGCSRSFPKRHGPLNPAEHLARVPLIHDETFLPRARVPTWTDWFHAAGVDYVDVPHGLTFNTCDHALDAA